MKFLAYFKESEKSPLSFLSLSLEQIQLKTVIHLMKKNKIPQKNKEGLDNFLNPMDTITL